MARVFVPAVAVGLRGRGELPAGEGAGHGDLEKFLGFGSSRWHFYNIDRDEKEGNTFLEGMTTT